MFDFPTSPATGTIVTVPDGSYRVWDSTKWRAAPSGSVIYPPGSYLPLAGGTITPGALNIANGNMVTHSVSPTLAQINYNKPALTLEASTFVGTVTGTTLQINSEFTGTINIGHIASWPGFNAGDVIVAGSGSTWTLANAHPPVPGGASFTASVSATPTGQVGGSTLVIQGAVTGTLAIGQRVVWSGGSDIIVNNPVDPVTAQFTGSISGTALSINTLNSGAITVGDIVHWTDDSVPPVAFTNTIVSGSGLSWTLTNNAGTVTSRPMTTNSNTWSLLGSYDNDVPSQAMTTYSVIKTNNRASFSPIVALPALSGTIPFGGIGNNSPAGLSLGAGSDNTSISSNFPLNFIDIQSVNNGSNFNGGRYGMNILMAVQNTPFTYTNPAFTLGGFYVRATAAIGSTNGADGQGNGVGSVFGGLLTASMGKAAGFWRSNVGLEVDVNVIGPAQAERIAGIQVVHQSGHSKQGLISDIAIGLGDQGRVTAGWRIGYSIGGPNSQWPIDPNGLLFRAGYAKTTPWALGLPGAAAAGGFDVQQVDFTGMSNVGGGFAFRADGAQIIPSLGNPGGSFVVGAAEFSGTSDGAKIDTTYQQMTGTPAVATGGSLWGVGDTLVDQYGNILQVATVTGGAIATVTVVRRGWQKSPPANPVAFNQLTPAAASNQNRTGTGATLNLTWAVPGNTLHLQPSGGPVVIDGILSVNNGFALGGPAGSGHGGTIYVTGSSAPLMITDQLWTPPSGMTPSGNTGLWMQGGGQSRMLMDSFTSASNIQMRRTGGTPGTIAALGNAQPIGTIQFQAYDGVAWSTTAQILATTINTQGTADHGTFLSFQGVVTGTTTVVEMMSLRSNRMLVAAPADDTINTIQANGGIRGTFLGASLIVSLVATGTTQAGALLLTRGINYVGTVPAGSGVALPVIGTTVTTGNWVDVYNATATALRVYGTGANTVDGAAAATGVPLSANARCRYIVTGGNTWSSTLLGGPSA